MRKRACVCFVFWVWSSPAGMDFTLISLLSYQFTASSPGLWDSSHGLPPKPLTPGAFQQHVPPPWQRRLQPRRLLKTSSCNRRPCALTSALSRRHGRLHACVQGFAEGQVFGAAPHFSVGAGVGANVFGGGGEIAAGFPRHDADSRQGGQPGG